MKIKWIITIPLIAFIIGTGFIIWAYSHKDTTTQVKKLYPVPDFTLTERSERQVSNTDLLGNIWIVNFIFTNCHDSCPLQTAKMALLQKDFQQDPKVKLLSITVDPENDTPEVLRQYADQFGADPEKWLFLTGPKDVIYDVAILGFKLPLIEKAYEEEERPFPKKQSSSSSKVIGPFVMVKSLSILVWKWITPAIVYAHEGESHFMHSDRFVLVDQEGDIRGYYRNNDRQDIARLKQHARSLLK